MPTIPVLKNVMTPFPHTVELDASLAEAQALMEEHAVRHLPVKDGHGELVGILSERDVQRLLAARGGSGERWSVRQATVRRAYVADRNTPLDRVLDHLVEERISSVLATKDGRLAGIFTTVDACRLLADLLRSQFPGGDAVA
jgi:acetoin utilization protein AcuB